MKNNFILLLLGFGIFLIKASIFANGKKIVKPSLESATVFFEGTELTFNVATILETVENENPGVLNLEFELQMGETRF